MPIRPEFRHLYRGQEYEARRARIRRRAGDRCEDCAKGNHSRVETVSGVTELGPGDRRPFMFWRGPGLLRDRFGREHPGLRMKAPSRFIYVVCTMAHLNHNPEDNADENLRFLCQWCHLNHDKPHHHETRSLRKDSGRELLALGLL